MDEDPESLRETQTGWDEELPEAIQQTWFTGRKQLSPLSSFPIKKFYFTESATIDTIELHGFLNVSEQAYAAAFISGPTTPIVNHLSLWSQKNPRLRI